MGSGGLNFTLASVKNVPAVPAVLGFGSSALGNAAGPEHSRHHGWWIGYMAARRPVPHRGNFRDFPFAELIKRAYVADNHVGGPNVLGARSRAPEQEGAQCDTNREVLLLSR